MPEWHISCYACGQVLLHHIMPILTVLQFRQWGEKTPSKQGEQVSRRLSNIYFEINWVILKNFDSARKWQKE